MGKGNHIMMILTSSLHLTEELPTELELRIARYKAEAIEMDLRCEFHMAEEAELIAQHDFERMPTLDNFQACKEASVWVIDASNALVDCLMAKVLP
jgi:hypothetical protein